MVNNMAETKYYVVDLAAKNYSELYDTIEEAQYDYDNDISYTWSLDAQIAECIDE